MTKAAIPPCFCAWNHASTSFHDETAYKQFNGRRGVVLFWGYFLKWIAVTLASDPLFPGFINFRAF